MPYYTSNAIYKKIAEQELNNFYWVSEDAWILVYADDEYTPKVLVLAHNNNWVRDENIIRLTYKISQISGIPMIQILFNGTQNEINSVDVAAYDQPFKTVSLESLRGIFNDFGLPISGKPTSKAINRAGSSAYHYWQRKNLGENIVVVDIDLMKVKNNEAIVILELKRSFFAIDRWNPYPKDYPNFYVLENLSILSKSQFFIVYNRMISKPNYFDDASSVSVFSFNNGNPIRHGSYDFERVFNDN